MKKDLTDAEIDVFYDRFEKWFLAGNFAAADEELAACDIPNCCDTEIITLLTVTWCASPKLKNRAKFYEDCVEELTRRRRAKDLWDGLKYGGRINMLTGEVSYE